MPHYLYCINLADDEGDRVEIQLMHTKAFRVHQLEQLVFELTPEAIAETVKERFTLGGGVSADRVVHHIGKLLVKKYGFFKPVTRSVGIFVDYELGANPSKIETADPHPSDTRGYIMNRIAHVMLRGGPKRSEG
jgi:hypothetical protein